MLILNQAVTLKNKIHIRDRSFLWGGGCFEEWGAGLKKYGFKGGRHAKKGGHSIITYKLRDRSFFIYNQSGSPGLLSK